MLVAYDWTNDVVSVNRINIVVGSPGMKIPRKEAQQLILLLNKAFGFHA